MPARGAGPLTLLVDEQRPATSAPPVRGAPRGAPPEAGGRERHACDPRAAPDRAPGGGRSPAAGTDRRGRDLGGARAALRRLSPVAARPGRAARAPRRGALALRLDGEPAGEAPLPPYITEPLADPERYQTVYADERARPPRRPPDCTSRRSCSSGSTSSGDAARRPRHLPARGGRASSTSTGCTASATRGPGAGTRIARRGSRARRRHDDCPRARDVRARRAAQRPHRPLRHAGLRVPPRRRAADELPPAPLDAARARDGVRRRRRRRATCTALAIAERYRFYSFGDAMLIL